MSEFSIGHWLVLFGLVVAIWAGVRHSLAPGRQPNGQRPIGSPSVSVMRPLGTFVFAIGVCALLWACLSGLAIDPSNKLADNLAMAESRNISLLWGFGLVAAGLLMRFSAGPKAPKDAPSDLTHRRCPACAEPVLREAVKCKHCGEPLTPLPLS